MAKSKATGFTDVAEVRMGSIVGLTPGTVTSEMEGRSVRGDRGGAIRTLKIELEGHKPTFEFTGVWSGHDLLMIKRQLRVAYHQYTRDLRRAKIASFPPTTKESD